MNTLPQLSVAALCIGLFSTSLLAQTGGPGDRGGRATLGTKIFGESQWRISECRNAGDLDGDSCDDILVGTPRSSPDGHVDVYSGATMTILRSHIGVDASDDFARAYGRLSDWNGDGVNEYFITAPATDGFLSKVDDNVGVLTIYDGATGAVIRVIGGDSVNGYFGANAFGETDFNGDGISDLAVMSECTGSTGASTEILIYSGATRVRQYVVYAPGYSGWELGSSITGVGDLNADGYADFAAGAPSRTLGSVLDYGMAKLYSGKTGDELYTYEAYPAAGYFGDRMTSADIDGDGSLELLVGAGDTHHFDGVNNHLNAGMITPLGFEPLMYISEREMSSSAGAVVTFYHNFPGANTQFALLASQTGTSPVTLQNGVPVPLVYDYATSVMYNSPPAWFTNSIGTTDAAGQAVTTLTLYPNDAASLVGTDIWFSALGFNGSEGPGMHWASCVQKLTVLP